MFKFIGTAMAFALIALPGAVVAPRAYAQTAVGSSSEFPDIPANHWAYAAVHDLADKGLVKGYPNGEFLGSRTMTRYEFATIIDRMVQTIADMQAGISAKYATQDDLNKLQVLVDTFQPQLDVIKANVGQAQADITALRGNVDDLRVDIQDAKALADKAQATANSSYGFGSSRKFQITGFIQARYISGSSDSQSGSKFTFPHGVGANSGPYNGTYMSGGNGATFEDRRARLKVTGQVTSNTRYAIHLDTSSTSTTVPVSVREGNINYTFNNGNAARNPTFTVGIFSNPFGYELALSPAFHLTPERPLAFNEGAAGVFSGQDFDKGAQLLVPDGRTKVTLALLSGVGFGGGTSTDRVANQVYRVGYTASSRLSAGASLYNGQFPTVVGLPDRRKELAGADVQLAPTSNTFLNAEYIAGKYEQIVYDSGAALTTVVAPGNKIAGYYVQGGYIFSPTGRHPLTLAACYDELQRSASGFSSKTIGNSGSNWNDVNVGYGILYNLDSATRLRIWYTEPSKVAHPIAPAAAALSPPNDGLLTTELQVKF